MDRAQAAAMIREVATWLETERVLSSQTKDLSPASPTTPSASPSPTLPPVDDKRAPALAWGKKVNQAFKDFVWQMSADFQALGNQLDGANAFMACMAFETMETFSPAVRPKRPDGSLVSSAVGLIQFLDATAHTLGTSTAALAAMSREKQLEYVWLYFRDFLKATGKPLKTLEDVYMVIHWPAAVGKPNEATMYVKGTSAFAANAGLDLNHDGVITKAEAGRLVRQKLARGLTTEFFG